MLTRRTVEDLVFQKPNLCGVRRFTQDSPILPDVWFAFAKPFTRAERSANPQYDRAEDALPGPKHGQHDLLLNPRRGISAADLYRAVGEILRQERGRPEGAGAHPSGLTYNESFVVVRLRFRELIRVALPLTHWWEDKILGKRGLADLDEKALTAAIDALGPQAESSPAAGASARPSGGGSPYAPGDLLWLVRLAGRLAWEWEQNPSGLPADTSRVSEPEPSAGDIVRAFMDTVRELPSVPDTAAKLWSVSLNRPVKLTLQRSVMATKADAARMLFDIKCDGISWAVIDSGIDACHPAFRKRPDDRPDGASAKAPARRGRGNNAPPETRVAAAYDFTRFRDILCVDVAGEQPGGDELEELIKTKKLTRDQRRRVRNYLRALKNGRYIDWAAIEPLLKVEYDPNGPAWTGHPHGTHVAGILAADWQERDDPAPPSKERLCGMCPDVKLYDFRVLKQDGTGDEYGILAALQFIRWLNANKDEPVIHGVNLSLSLPHDVANFACGQTPICEECERLVGSGVIVVVAAGNEGRAQFISAQGGITTGYRGISITDPGNAEAAITVGATHRFKPHTYGVSYFSSRGPTGDGRSKPDLVAPGEKIVSCMPQGSAAEMDGTSMAAPHVSGAAVLLLARHRELMGKPARVKQILCETATDLGRERFFQGHGMVDVLRAIQSI